ncbi:hypothetical protein BV372_06785 [Nostoc sp. T09]|nr:hypothetical protein BV372_06785 [Nostoc sp. T09]
MQRNKLSSFVFVCLICLEKKLKYALKNLKLYGIIPKWFAKSAQFRKLSKLGGISWRWQFVAARIKTHLSHKTFTVKSIFGI